MEIVIQPVNVETQSIAFVVRLRVCKRPIRRYDVSGGGLAGSGGVHGGSGGSISISLPGVENHDTERRRQIALKALSDRLSKAEAQSSATSQQSWPSLGNERQISSETCRNYNQDVYVLYSLSMDV